MLVESKVGYKVDKILLKDKCEEPYGKLNDPVMKYISRSSTFEIGIVLTFIASREPNRQKKLFSTC
jgi:hypothetical protein